MCKRGCELLWVPRAAKSWLPIYHHSAELRTRAIASVCLVEQRAKRGRRKERERERQRAKLGPKKRVQSRLAASGPLAGEQVAAIESEPLS